MRRLALATCIAAALPLGAQKPARWLATWSPSPSAAAPIPPSGTLDRTPTYVDRTIRQIVHTTLGGDSVRIRLTNEYGERALVIGAAHIAVRDTGAAIRTETDKALTFGGRGTVTLRPGAVMFSDPIAYKVPALTDLSVSLWVKDTIRASTRHALGLQINYVSPHGDLTSAAAFAPDTTIFQWLWLTGVDVVNAKGTGVIVTIGNSITDGAASTPSTNSRWPDVLARRLLASSEPPKAIVNAGISGGRVLAPIAGPSALSRFDRDVLMQPGVTHVIVLEAINDLTRGTGMMDPRDSVTAEDIIAGYKQLITRAHERGVMIFGATLTPVGGLNIPTIATVDVKRRAVNDWIRTSKAFDGVIDFEAATRDPSQSDRFLPAYDSGDHLHPSDAGYKAMGEFIDLTLFRKGRP